MNTIDPHVYMDPDSPVTVKNIFPDDPGIMPQSIMYIHLPSEFARRSLLYATYAAKYFCERHYSAPRRYFDYYCCFIVESGRLFATIGEKEFHVPEQGILILNGKIPHMHRAEGGKVVMQYICFDGFQAAAFYDRIVSIHGNVVENYNYLVVDNAFNSILALATDGFQNEFRISAQTNVILGELLSPPPASSSQPSQAVTRAISFMENHFLDDILVEEIASAAHYSEHYFSQLFKTATGLSPHAYLRKLRVIFAKQMLATTDRPIEEIAEKCGFGSTQNFINSFKQFCDGFTPSQYRKKAKT